MAESQVEEHVGRLTGEPQSRRTTAVDPLRQPSVIGVTREIARFDIVVPKAGDQDAGGDAQDS